MRQARPFLEGILVFQIEPQECPVFEHVEPCYCRRV
jgi:hypothetical protein